MSPPKQLITVMVRESLAQGQPVWLTVISGSMRPFLEIGDEVRVESCAVEALQTGDIIVVEEDGSTLTHRFYKYTAAGELLIRGDNYSVFDPPLPVEAFIGRVTGRRRGADTLGFDTDLGRVLHQHHAQWATRESRWLARLGRNPQAPSLAKKVTHRLFLFLSS
ncbi:MAG: hypothetical protein KDE51_18975 [Anaerolineales bacterium]|nr:hypothetical protein [Anaerolineales bacterium]